jgi:N,N-dimethylformamidase
MKTAALVVLALTFAANAAAAEGKAHEPQAIEGYALSRSYAPGQIARIALLGRMSGTRVAIFHAGLERSNAMPHDELLGAPVDAQVSVSPREARVRIGDWKSGLYFARIDASAGHAYAPFVVRPRRLGEHRIAVMLPTNTWQAYNFRDANRDGIGDTWYADQRLSVELDRPFQKHGVPPHYAQYDLLFLRWLARSGKQVDVLSDDDLERVPSGAALARAYDLIVFSGHHEYVTTHEYDVTEDYRDRGGNLLFLSANNFFYHVTRTGSVLHRIGRWRDAGRPEAALVGIQYLDWNHDEFGNGPYVVRTPGWPFAGTGLRPGSRFGTYGIEIDAPMSSSPPGLKVLATIPNLFGRGRSASMTYYTTRAGAKVFAAGAINFGGTALWRPAAQVLEHVWAELAQP